MAAPLTIQDVKTILTRPAGINLVVVKVLTSEPGLYGVGCATFTQRFRAVHTAIEEHLKPFLLGREVDRIEEEKDKLLKDTRKVRHRLAPVLGFVARFFIPFDSLWPQGFVRGSPVSAWGPKWTPKPPRNSRKYPLRTRLRDAWEGAHANRRTRRSAGRRSSAWARSSASRRTNGTRTVNSKPCASKGLIFPKATRTDQKITTVCQVILNWLVVLFVCVVFVQLHSVKVSPSRFPLNLNPQGGGGLVMP